MKINRRMKAGKEALIDIRVTFNNAGVRIPTVALDTPEKFAMLHHVCFLRIVHISIDRNKPFVVEFCATYFGLFEESHDLNATQQQQKKTKEKLRKVGHMEREDVRVNVDFEWSKRRVSAFHVATIRSNM